MTSSHTHHPARANETLSYATVLLQSVKRYRAFVVILSILLVTLLGWKLYSDVRAAHALESQRALATRTLSDRISSLQTYSVRALGWSVKSELTHGNLPRVRDMFFQFKEQPFVSQVLFVRNDGTTVASTDPELEGRSFGSGLRGSASLDEQITMERTKEGTVRFIVPIVNTEIRLGTLIVVYDAAVLAVPG